MTEHSGPTTAAGQGLSLLYRKLDPLTQDELDRRILAIEAEAISIAHSKWADRLKKPEAGQPDSEALRRFVEYVANMNPTSGQLTFAIRRDLQERALAALAVLPPSDPHANEPGWFDEWDVPPSDPPDKGCSECDDWMRNPLNDGRVSVENPHCPIRAGNPRCVRFPPSDPPALEAAHEPGDSHRYQIECEVCGQRGMVNLSIEPQVSAQPAR